MADLAKHASINGGTLIFELKTVFSLLTTKRTIAFAYGFVFVFIAFSVFLAFTPSSNSSSLWFTDTSFISISSSNNGSDQSYRSQFSSIFSHIFPNSSQQVPSFAPLPSPTTIKPQNTTFQSPITQKQSHNKDLHDRVEGFNPNQSKIGAPKSPVSVNQSANSLLRNSSESKNITGYEEKRFADKGFNSNFSSSNTKNQSQSKDFRKKVEVLKPNQSKIGAPKSPVAGNQSMNSNITGNEKKRVAERGVNSNFTSSMLKKQSNGTNFGVPAKQRSENLVESLMNCDLFDGEWVRDESYPLYKPGSCSLIDEQFNCFLNGRPDNGYQKLKWKPKGCNLPRLNGSHMLELLRGKRLVFVGDSLNRNMWESLVCILRNSVKDQRKVYEASGRQQFRSQSSYSFVFEDYGFTVEFFVSPFLVQQWELADKNGSKKETLRLDMIGSLGDQYKSADIIIFNTGHWWTHDKLSNGEQYYQEGSRVYRDLNVTKAFQKAITTWGRWVDAHINPKKTLVFFRGYSASHFSGGQWNSGGQCDNETEPIKNETYLSQYPEKMTELESVLKGMKTRVSYLNVTRITDYRKDGHPSIYRKQSYSEEERRSPLSYQDCSHWCLPGVPDAWNELLYAELLIKQNLKKQQQKRP